MKRMDLSPITSKEIAKETHLDHILSRVYHFMMTGWPEQLSEGDMTLNLTFKDEWNFHVKTLNIKKTLKNCLLVSEEGMF